MLWFDVLYSREVKYIIRLENMYLREDGWLKDCRIHKRKSLGLKIYCRTITAPFRSRIKMLAVTARNGRTSMSFYSLPTLRSWLIFLSRNFKLSRV